MSDRTSLYDSQSTGHGSDFLGTTGAGQFKQLLGVMRRDVATLLPEGSPTDATRQEAFALLLAYGCAIEKILAEAAGSGTTLPGHRVSLRSYVEQLLGGEAQGVTIERLESYFADAVTQFGRSNLDSEAALSQWAQRIVDQFKPSRIEDRVKTSNLAQLFNLHEGAYWREYKREFHSLDAGAVRQVAGKRES